VRQARTGAIAPEVSSVGGRKAADVSRTAYKALLSVAFPTPVVSGRIVRHYVGLPVPKVAEMDFRFYRDPETGAPHIYEHGITENEVFEVFRRPREDRPAADGARATVGQTAAGRCLRIVYVPDPEPRSVFVVTAYEVRGKALKAYRRRQRRRPR
jgi:hypothetical protein